MADTADLDQAEATSDPGAIGPSGVALAEDPDRLQRLARRNLWMHFTRMGSYDEQHAVPVIVRGDGCYVYDEHGKRYLDGLSALYCVNVGHGRAELADAAAAQARKLAFYTNWSYAHPTSIELAARVAELAPGNLNRVFFTSGGSEAVESAWKLAKAYHRARGESNRHKVISRHLAYHGTSMGALTVTGLPPLREPFEPLTPGGTHVPNTNSYRWSEDRDPLWAADAIEEAIEFEGAHTVAAVILEPVQNGGGCFVPQDGYFQRVREICDRHGVLLISDEVICAWGRLGHWFGCERFDYQPDMITTAKGISSAYAPLGAVIAGDHIAEPFMHGKESFVHGFTFGGHPVACAVGLANIDLMEREDLNGNVRDNERLFREMLDGLRDLPIVGDVRGAGYFHAIELVKDKETKETFDDAESEELLRGFLSGELYRRGLICRTDDRGDPIVQLSPPLIAGPEQFEEIIAILRPVLDEAGERMAAGGAGRSSKRAERQSGRPLPSGSPPRRSTK
jgi:adenosylmethionine-8-amino-7-oxononanoate aminotransferase